MKAKSTDSDDPYKTSPDSLILHGVATTAASDLVVADMLCEIKQWSHETRSVTCGISANLPRYTGVLVITYKNGTHWSKTVVVEQPIIKGLLSPWGIAVIGAYGTSEIAEVHFENAKPLATWDQTTAARSTLDGTYTSPQVTYPPPVTVSAMQCSVSEFLVGKSQANITPTYTMTCVLAGNVHFYGGYLATWFHTFDSRIPESGKPAPVPLQNSAWDNANHTAYVRVQHDLSYGAIRYWGITAFGILSDKRLAWDRVVFYPEREMVSAVPSAVPPPYPPPPTNDWQQMFFIPPAPMNDWQKQYFVNRYCDPGISCLRCGA